MKKILFTLFLLMVVTSVSAQVTISPSTVNQGYTGKLTIIYDPAAGNGGMKNATKCYAHMGVLTKASKTSADWKYVIGSWRGDTQPQFTKTEDGKWQLEVDNMYTFFGCPETETITHLCFVFHDGPGGSLEGKNSSGGDILYELGVEGGGSSDIWEGFTPADCVEKARPEGIVQGIYYDDNDPTTVTLCTYAASKTEPAQHVFLIGDNTEWKLSNDYQLYRDGNYFWIKLTNLTPKQIYRFQYAVVRADGVKKQICDLYSELVLSKYDAYEPAKVWGDDLPGYPIKGADGGYVSVFQTGRDKFEWSDATQNFQRPDKNNLIIYELWVYDFTTDRTLKAVQNKLKYIKNLGVNAIELMPMCEFDGNISWGYNPNLYFALDKAYCTPTQFKEFIDECHKYGIAVIMDMVFNHVLSDSSDENPMYKLYPYGTDYALNPWFNVNNPHGDESYYKDWNHGFEPAQQMFIRSLDYWLDEYKVDGFRMDMSHGFCDENAGTSVKYIEKYYDEAIAPHNAYFILEHWGNNMNSERPELVNHGCLCWNNTVNAYYQTTMGWLNNGDALNDASKLGYVSYCESHDEERMQYNAKINGNGTIKTDEATRIGRVAEQVAFNVMLTGPHMLWMWEELGYDYSINSSLEKPTSTDSNNRTAAKPRPEGYMKDENRMAQYDKICQTIQLRTRLRPEWFTGTATISVGSGQSLRTVKWGDNIYMAGNFDSSQNKTFYPDGGMYNYFTGQQSNGTAITLKPGEFVIYTSEKVDLPVIEGIENVNTTSNVYRNTAVYNLAGQRVNSNAKGLLIINGKKILR